MSDDVDRTLTESIMQSVGVSPPPKYVSILCPISGVCRKIVLNVYAATRIVGISILAPSSGSVEALFLYVWVCCMYMVGGLEDQGLFCSSSCCCCTVTITGNTFVFDKIFTILKIFFGSYIFLTN